MKKLIATIVTTTALVLSGFALIAPPAAADQHCTPGEGSCVIDPPVVEPCVPGESYPTGGVCSLPGGQEIAAVDWAKVVADAEQKVKAATQAAAAAELATQAATNARRVAEQAADTYRLQTIELTAQVAKMDRTIDRKTATIKRLRAKVRDLRQD